MQKSSTPTEKPTQKEPIIMLIGVGGGGNNAVNYMYKRGIKDVQFAVINTDDQALTNSPVPIKLQIGPKLTNGLGAGANPEIGKNAALESKEAIKNLLHPNVKMVFITLGLGGGTGTGAGPVLACEAKKKGILTIGIVTKPFAFEGRKKIEKAEKGINELKKNCDTVLVILNERIREMHKSLSITDAFSEADEVLTTAAKSIAEIITVHGYVNVDFEDVKTVLKDAGAAIMGSGIAQGQDRGLKAAESALKSPLLDYKDIHGAKKILLSIISGDEEELTMDELTAITNHIYEQAGDNAEIIFGHGHDPQLKDKVKVTIIATGFNEVDDIAITENTSSPHTNAKNKIYPIKKSNGTPPSNITKKQRALYFRERAQNLINSLKEGETYHLSDQEIREKLDLPAYLRKNIPLNYTPPEGVKPIRYHLYEKESNS